MERQAYWIDDFSAAYGPSRATVYREIKAKRLRAFKVGRRTAISRESAEAWVRMCEQEFSGLLVLPPGSGKGSK